MKITARYTVIVMLTIAVANLYSFRSIPTMIKPYLIQIVGGDTKNVTKNECPEPSEKVQTKPLSNITEPISHQHAMKLAYDFARATAHFVSGMSCDISGGRYIVFFSVLGSAILTASYPSLLINSPPWGMIIFNIVSGSLSGYVMPAIMTLISSWAPLNRRTVFVGVVYAGGPLSKVLEYALIEFFTVISRNWENVFYISAILGFLYILIHMYTVFSKPGMHPLISREERKFLEKELGTKIPKRIPWFQIIKDKHVIAILFGKCAHLWMQNINQTYLPQYLKLVVRLDLATRGAFYMLLPHLLHFFCIIVAAVLVQISINAHKVELTHLRIFCTMFSAVSPAILMIMMSYAGCNVYMIQVLSAMAICSMCTMNLGIKSNILDLTTHFAGFCEAFINGIATFGVMATPKLLGVIITEHCIVQWRRFYWITLAFTSFLATMHYIFVGTDRAKWDHLKKDNVTMYHDDSESESL
nr:putative inorganic phosphate cotransporter [Onthophagus taurus]